VTPTKPNERMGGHHLTVDSLNGGGEGRKVNLNRRGRGPRRLDKNKLREKRIVDYSAH